MKTLDEVIDKLHEAYIQIEKNDGYNCFYKDDDELKEEVIYFLEEYRKMKKDKRHAYKKGYEDGKVKQHQDDEVSRRWEEDFRASQMPWNHYTEMGG